MPPEVVTNGTPGHPIPAVVLHQLFVGVPHTRRTAQHLVVQQLRLNGGFQLCITGGS